jgi:hypothetical protein
MIKNNSKTEKVLNHYSYYENQLDVSYLDNSFSHSIYMYTIVNHSDIFKIQKVFLKPVIIKFPCCWKFQQLRSFSSHKVPTTYYYLL